MHVPRAKRSVPAVSLVAVLVLAAIGFLLLPAASAASTSSAAPRASPGPSTLPSLTLVSAPPSGAKGPDDITSHSLLGNGSGTQLLWTAYQNGINPDGTPGTTGGPTQSTIAGYDPSSGTLVKTINITGKIDGLAADPTLGRLIATINEDSNSSLCVVNQTSGYVAHYAFSPSPTVSGNGGTDSIAIWHGAIYVVHSNPNDTSQPAEYLVTLHPTMHVAQLTPLFRDDSVARNAVSGSSAPMALVDPDTSLVLPSLTPRFGGELATISQADGAVVFAQAGAHHHLEILNVTDNKSGNVPPIDGMTVATASEGTLYVVDAKAGTITALTTDGWPAGTVFVGEPSDNGNPLIGTLNLSSGAITPLGNHFVSPKGLLFVPDLDGSPGVAHHEHHGHHDHDARGHGGEGDGHPDWETLFGRAMAALTTANLRSV
ncbi:MAG TPA: hypothetical protein VJQ43_01815 [Thermoplasmata archaeon]|nr:hypothetical protein [Thermoplasmata archaeon]